MNFLKRWFTKKEEIKPIGKKESLKKLALSKLKKINSTKPSEKSFEEFAFVFKVFISKMFGIKKQVTHDELVVILGAKKIKRKLRNKISLLSSDIDKINYAERPIYEEQFSDMLERFEEIIQEL